MNNTGQSYIAGNEGQYIYEVAPRGAKVLLLTIGGVAVIGQWYGKLGEFFLGWCPLPKRDHDKEKQLGLTR